MAVASMNFYSTTGAKLNNIAVIDGNIIFVRDKRKIYVDAKGERTEYSSIITLIDDATRVGMANPLEGFYFVKETEVLWRYDRRWKALTAKPESNTIYLDGDEESLPTIGQDKTLYITDYSLYRWNGTEYVNLGDPMWKDF